MVGISFVAGALLAAPFVAFGLRGYDNAGWIEHVVGSAIFGLFPMVIVLSWLGTRPATHWTRVGRHPLERALPRARVVHTVRDDA
jgi:hypothetical protein